MKLRSLIACLLAGTLARVEEDKEAGQDGGGEAPDRAGR
jgi:hypothetical protein